MISRDESALVCDFAETYGILNFRSLPARLVATLAAGLRDDSRIKMKLTGVKHPPEIILLASAVDRLSLLVWAQSKDGQKGRNKPPSIVAALTEEDRNKAEKPVSFSTPEEFEAARAEILERIRNVNDSRTSICTDPAEC